MKTTSKAKLSTVFAQRIADLDKNAEQRAKAYDGTAGTPPGWNISSEQTTTLTDVEKLGKNYNRDEPNDNYAEVMQDPANAGTVGDTISIKSQIDFVATEQRAFNTRHATVCRAIAHMHGRSKGSATVFGSIRKMAEDVIRNSAVAPTPGVDAPTSNTGSIA